MAKTLSGSGYAERRTWTVISEPYEGIKTETAHGPAPDNRMVITYSAAGKPVLSTDASGGETAKSYNKRGLLTREATKIENGKYAITNHVFDDLGREVKTYKSDDTGCEPVSYAYDAWGRKISETDALGNTSTFTYNMLDFLLSETRPHSDSSGPAALVKRYQRDQAGRMIALRLSTDIDPVRRIYYNGMGQVLSAISYPGSGYGSITSSYAWDSSGKMASETDGAGKTWSYAYNAQGLLSASTDPAQNKTSLSYDKEGRMIRSEVKDTSNSLVSFIDQAYTPFGETDTRAFSGGGNEDYTYDAYGRLTGVTSQGNISLAYSGYDQANRPKTLTYNLDGSVYTENLTYKQNGAIAAIGLPAGAVGYAYDSEGRLSGVTSPEGAASYAYDSRGLPESCSLSGGVNLSYSYYKDGRPKDAGMSSGKDTASVSLTYNAYGKINGMTRDTGTDAASGTYTYAYDRIGRLASASSPAAIPDYSYTYDPRGPVAQKTETVKGTPSQTTVGYAYDSSGRLLYDFNPASPAVHINEYTYDAAGRMTAASGPRGLEELAYDGLNRLVSADTGGGAKETSYTYDQSGRMVIRKEIAGENTSENIFLPFAQSQEVAGIYDGTSGSNLYSYTCEPSGKHISQTDSATSTTTYPFRSPRSDVLALTDTSGNITQRFAYEPFGEMEEGYNSDGTPFLYQDDYLDESTSLYQMQARWYDPSTSLFTSMDPQMGDASDPSLRSPYAYCGDDPVYNSDPTGKSWMDFLKACNNPVLGPMMRGNRGLAMAILGMKSTSNSARGNAKRVATKSGTSSSAPRSTRGNPGSSTTKTQPQGEFNVNTDGKIVPWSIEIPQGIEQETKIEALSEYSKEDIAMILGQPLRSGGRFSITEWGKSNLKSYYTLYIGSGDAVSLGKYRVSYYVNSLRYNGCTYVRVSINEANAGLDMPSTDTGVYIKKTVGIITSKNVLYTATEIYAGRKADSFVPEIMPILRARNSRSVFAMVEIPEEYGVPLYVGVRADPVVSIDEGAMPGGKGSSLQNPDYK